MADFASVRPAQAPGEPNSGVAERQPPLPCTCNAVMVKRPLTVDLPAPAWICCPDSASPMLWSTHGHPAKAAVRVVWPCCGNVPRFTGEEPEVTLA
jgi:hypothetical protein